MTSIKKFSILLFWIVILVASSIYLIKNFSLSTDITQFLPDAISNEEKFALQQIREGLANRIILLALSGESPEKLAETSKKLKTSLQNDALIENVLNGENSAILLDNKIAEIQQDQLFQYRYLLDPALSKTTFDEKNLASTINQVIVELSSPLGADIKPLLQRDPTQHYLRLLESMNPLTVQNQNGVWFSADSSSALLIIVASAAGFDTTLQEKLIETITEKLHDIDPTVAANMTGPAVFAVSTRHQITKEATLLSTAALVILIIFLWICLHRFYAIFLTAIPILSGIIIGINAVLFFFDSIHGLTLAFGSTLLGIGVDYPIHVITHAKNLRLKSRGSGALWLTLFYSFLTTFSAFLILVISHFSGLRQLGIFILVGLTCAYLVTRWVIPVLLSKNYAVNSPKLVKTLATKQGQLKKFVYALPIIWIISLFFSFSPQWNDGLTALQPLSPELLEKDKIIREQFAIPHTQAYFVVHEKNEQTLLETLETLKPHLQNLKQENHIGDFEIVTDWLPSEATQLARQALLPDEKILGNNLKAATKNNPLTPEFFNAFLSDLNVSKTLAPIRSDEITTALWQQRVTPLLTHNLIDDSWQAKTPLYGMIDAKNLSKLSTQCQPNCFYLNLKSISENLLSHYRQQLIQYLFIGVIVLGLLLLWLISPLQNAIRAILCLGTGLALTFLILNYLSTGLNLIHLLGLILVIGLGLDYAFFISRRADTQEEQQQTTFSLLICIVSTLCVFGLLSLANSPVLKYLGQTVFIGTTLSFLLLFLFFPNAGNQKSSKN